MNIEIPPDEEPKLAEVRQFPAKPRSLDTERVLTTVRSYACMHKRFSIDDRLQEVECSDCKEKLSPMFALVSLCQQENRYHELHARYQDEMKRLNERSRTKCDHCGQMTRISK